MSKKIFKSGNFILIQESGIDDVSIPSKDADYQDKTKNVIISNPKNTVDYVDVRNENLTDENGDAYESSALSTSSLVNSNYTTFSGASSTGFSATSDGLATHIAGTADEVVFVAGKKYKIDFTLVLNSGTAPQFAATDSLGGSFLGGSAQLSVAGANTYTFECVTSGTGTVEFFNASTATDFVISSFSIVQVDSNLSADNFLTWFRTNAGA